MSGLFSPENLEDLNVGDVLAQPNVDPRVKALVLRLNSDPRGVSLGELADLAGLDARAAALQIVAELILAEAARLRDRGALAS